MAGDGDGRCTLSTRGGYFRVDIAAGAVTTDRRRRARTASTSPRSRGAPTAGWCSAAPTAPCTHWRSDTAVGARAEDLRSGGWPCHTRQYRRRAGPRADLGDRLRRRRARTPNTRCGRARAPPRWPPTRPGRVLVADTRGGELLVYGVDPLILRQRYPVRDAPYGLAGSATHAGVGVADGDEHRRWLRSGHRHPRREGAISNRAATELPGLRRCVGHPYVVSGVGRGCAGDQQRGGADERLREEQRHDERGIAGPDAGGLGQVRTCPTSTSGFRCGCRPT